MTDEEIIEKALYLLGQSNTLEALHYFDKVKDRIASPEARSGYALCIALERGLVKEGIALCIRAINDDPDNPLHYLNLGRIYLKDGKKAVALDVFRKGLKHRPESGPTREIAAILSRLGVRRTPVFSFLPRGHFVNKLAGLILHRLKIR